MNQTSTPAAALLAFGKAWRLDGDLAWCRGCNRALIVNRAGEPLHHQAGCPNGEHVHPWAELRAALGDGPEYPVRERQLGHALKSLADSAETVQADGNPPAFLRLLEKRVGAAREVLAGPPSRELSAFMAARIFSNRVQTWMARSFGDEMEHPACPPVLRAAVLEEAAVASGEVFSEIRGEVDALLEQVQYLGLRPCSTCGDRRVVERFDAVEPCPACYDGGAPSTPAAMLREAHRLALQIRGEYEVGDSEFGGDDGVPQHVERLCSLLEIDLPAAMAGMEPAEFVREAMGAPGEREAELEWRIRDLRDAISYGMGELSDLSNETEDFETPEGTSPVKPLRELLHHFTGTLIGDDDIAVGALPLTGDREPVTIMYTNHRGETRPRKVLPVRVWWGTTRWHPQPQWLLDVVDTEKEERRTFALSGFAVKGASVRKRLEKLTEVASAAAADLDVFRQLPTIGEAQDPAELARIGRSLEAAARDCGVCLGCGALNPEEAAERCVPQEDSCYGESAGLWPERGATRDERRQMDVEHAAAGRRFLAELSTGAPSAEFWARVEQVEDATPGDCPKCGGVLAVPVTDTGAPALPTGQRSCVRCGATVPPEAVGQPGLLMVPDLASPRLAGHLSCGIAADLWDH